MYKNKKAYNYSDDGLLLSSNTNLFSTEYSYYLNTDLKSQMKVFDYNGSNKLNYEYNYSGSSVITSIKSISSTLYRTATNNSYISSSVYILEHNTNLYNYSYDEEDNLLNFKYNNIVYFTNSYLKGNYDHQKLLNTVTLNQSTSNYSIFYNSYDLPTQISFNNLTIFNFIYDEVFNLTRVNLFESDHFYQYEYDNMNDLVKKSSPIESIEINKYRSNIQHTKETYVNYSSINFKQKYENKNSVILNDLLSTLKECNAYIGLFDCLIDPEETDPDFKYLKLIKDYYKKDDFISINPLFNSSGPYLYNIFNLKYLRLYNKDHFTFTAPHPIIDNKVCGNIGFSYLINRHFIGWQSLISFNILNYSFKISYILGETCYINFSIW